MRLANAPGDNARNYGESDGVHARGWEELAYESVMGRKLWISGALDHWGMQAEGTGANSRA